MLLVKYVNPDGYIIVEGDFDSKQKELRNYVPISFNVPDAGRILIPQSADCRIAFIRELTNEEYKKYKDADEKRKKQQEEETELQELERKAAIDQRRARLSFAKKPNLTIPGGKHAKKEN